MAVARSLSVASRTKRTSRTFGYAAAGGSGSASNSAHTAAAPLRLPLRLPFASRAPPLPPPLALLRPHVACPSQAHFEQFGRLTDVVVMHEAGGRKPRGFGFVTFADVASVQKVLQSRLHPVDGRGVEVKLAVTREMMSSDEAATGAELVGHGGEYGGTYPAGAPPYGEAVSGDPGEYAPSGYGAQYGYQPSVPYGYVNAPAAIEPPHSHHSHFNRDQPLTTPSGAIPHAGVPCGR